MNEKICDLCHLNLKEFRKEMVNILSVDDRTRNKILLNKVNVCGEILHICQNCESDVNYLNGRMVILPDKYDNYKLSDISQAYQEIIKDHCATTGCILNGLNDFLSIIFDIQNAYDEEDHCKMFSTALNQLINKHINNNDIKCNIDLNIEILKDVVMDLGPNKRRYTITIDGDPLMHCNITEIIIDTKTKEILL